jgi:hypothetical protein
MSRRFTFPYPEKPFGSTREDTDLLTEALSRYPGIYPGDTPYERMTGRMTFPLKRAEHGNQEERKYEQP